MALVEPVIGKAREQIENGFGLRRFDAALDTAGNKAFALRLHFLADLFAHGAAQLIGLRQRIAGEHLRDLHHLFLIDDDSVGFPQNGLELWVNVIRAFERMFTRAISRNIRHRAGPIQRDQRDDVLETIGAHVDERAPHSGAFHLKHADRFAVRHQLVGLRIVERQIG